MLRGLCSFQTGFYINCMAEASPNPPSVGSLSHSLSLSLSLSLRLPPISSHISSLSRMSVFFFSFITNMDKKKQKDNSHSQTVYQTSAFFAGLEQRAQLRRLVTFFFLLLLLLFFLQRAFVTRDLQGYRSL